MNDTDLFRLMLASFRRKPPLQATADMRRLGLWLGLPCERWTASDLLSRIPRAIKVNHEPV